MLLEEELGSAAGWWRWARASPAAGWASLVLASGSRAAVWAWQGEVLEWLALASGSRAAVWGSPALAWALRAGVWAWQDAVWESVPPWASVWASPVPAEP